MSLIKNGERLRSFLEAEKIPVNRPIIAVQPFSLWQYKEWGSDNYSELIRRITSRYELPVILTGSPDEAARAKSLTSDCGPNVYNLAGKTTHRHARRRLEGQRFIHRGGQRWNAHRGSSWHSDRNHLRSVRARFMGAQGTSPYGHSPQAPLRPLPTKGL